MNTVKPLLPNSDEFTTHLVDMHMSQRNHHRSYKFYINSVSFFSGFCQFSLIFKYCGGAFFSYFHRLCSFGVYVGQMDFHC